MKDEEPQSALFDMPKVKRTRRGVPLDLIFTGTPAHLSSFVAWDAGWLIGIRSKEWPRVGPEEARWSWHINEIAFVDNEWMGYDHKTHMDCVKALKPKYATVRDYVDEEQAQQAGIEYFSLGRILEMAEEVSEYAQNVIVIPKVDVLDLIPDRFMLGYSVPSSYGATPLPLEAFAGRRIHLLGGSWQTQRSMLVKMGDDVVSADLNQPWKASRYGSVIMGDGTARDLVSFGMYPRNSSLASLALSLGNIAAAVQDMETMANYKQRPADAQQSPDTGTRCPTCDSGKRAHRGFPVGAAPVPCEDPWHDEWPPHWPDPDHMTGPNMKDVG